MIKQLSVFLKNQPGELARIMAVLKDAEVKSRAMCITDTGENGILRLLPDHWEIGESALKQAGIVSHVSKVLVLELDYGQDMAGVFSQLLEHHLNIEYLYSFDAIRMVLKIEDAQEASTILRDLGYRVVEEEELR